MSPKCFLGFVEICTDPRLISFPKIRQKTTHQYTSPAQIKYSNSLLNDNDSTRMNVGEDTKIDLPAFSTRLPLVPGLDAGSGDTERLNDRQGNPSVVVNSKERADAGYLDSPSKRPPLSGVPNSIHQTKAQDRIDFKEQSPPMDEIEDEESELDPEMILQPESLPISHDQLAVEVKGNTLRYKILGKGIDSLQGIYARLVMTEAKCIDVDSKQSEADQGQTQVQQLANVHWQGLIALHQTLLHQHHDFFLASQHPSTSPALSRLAAKYSMPARMWRHGIYDFLEILRHRLPESFDYMLTFTHLAYSMMALNI